MDRLLFPVKLGPQLQNVSQDFATTSLGETAARPVKSGLWAGTLAGAALWATLGGALAAALPGCGYHPIYGAQRPRYAVQAGHYSTASFEAVQATVAGVRSELGAAEALGAGYPRVVVEVLRVDERSTGVRDTPSQGPLARGSEIVVVGRAQVFEQEGGAATIDTGDMSRAAQFASGNSPSVDAAARERAVRDASRRLGQALGRSVLGLPEPLEG